jgi:hypothetical protein
MHVCGGCRRALPRTDEYFHNAYGRKDGLQSHCKACQCAAAKRGAVEQRKREQDKRAFAVAAFAHMAKALA